ncbi:hypothetical protein [Lactococcus garvieae]|jgi:hypothetical protein|uniref:Uncharacterized protein n=1 Tax=Lactococcus garvieae TaxID=1363 RepID=A0A1I4H8Y6_9LACT|nr:hypothetical protein [Lactococcus garvieae]SFL38123.1 hypothetical protein SAMN05216438_10771 [Lactococcus garvieae]
MHDNISDTGKYKFEINLPKVSPHTQATLDDLKDKTKIFIDNTLKDGK